MRVRREMGRLEFAMSGKEAKELFDKYLEFKKFLGDFFTKLTNNVVKNGGSVHQGTIICYRIICWIFRDLSLSLTKADIDIQIELAKKLKGEG